MRLMAIGGIATAGIVLAACTGPGEPTSPDPSTSPPAEPTPSATEPTAPATVDVDRYTPPPEGLLDEDSRELIEPQTVAQWDEESRQSVVDTAEEALRAFAQPHLSEEEWWAGIEPYFTDEAAGDYAWVDPANIPASEVTGPGELVDDTSAYVGYVQVPTDAGTYTLILNRRTGDAPWAVTRITPPSAEN